MIQSKKDEWGCLRKWTKGGVHISSLVCSAQVQVEENTKDGSLAEGKTAREAPQVCSQRTNQSDTPHCQKSGVVYPCRSYLGQSGAILVDVPWAAGVMSLKSTATQLRKTALPAALPAVLPTALPTASPTSSQTALPTPLPIALSTPLQMALPIEP